MVTVVKPLFIFTDVGNGTNTAKEHQSHPYKHLFCISLSENSYFSNKRLVIFSLHVSEQHSDHTEKCQQTVGYTGSELP